MKISNKYLIVISLLITTFSGCKKGGSLPEPIIADTTNPTISIITPTAGQVFATANTIVFQASFADNVKLKSYNIAISKVLAGGFILKYVPSPVPWNYLKLETIFTPGVKKQDITLNDIVIPSNINGNPVATGDYNFKVTCTDDTGNMASITLIIKIS